MIYRVTTNNFAENRKARFNYELLEEMEAGIELLGHEVRAVKTGKASLEGSHITVRGGETYLVGASIAPYQPNNTPAGYEPARNRRLLLTKKEIDKLSASERGLTIVPLTLYNKGGKIKVRVAIARGKKKFDKRQSIRRRDDEREMRRTLKENL